MHKRFLFFSFWRCLGCDGQPRSGRFRSTTHRFQNTPGTSKKKFLLKPRYFYQLDFNILREWGIIRISVTLIFLNAQSRINYSNKNILNSVPLTIAAFEIIDIEILSGFSKKNHLIMFINWRCFSNESLPLKGDLHHCKRFSLTSQIWHCALVDRQIIEIFFSVIIIENCKS